MKQTKLHLMIICLVGFGLTNSQAQQAVLPAGNSIISNSGSLNYSIGQLAYTTLSGTGGSADEGVQHAITVQVITGIENEGINLKLSAYPNPTIDQLTVHVENPKEGLTASLFDINGTQIINSPITSYQTILDMNGLSRSVYFLRISNTQTVLKTFKIIKN